MVCNICKIDKLQEDFYYDSCNSSYYKRCKKCFIVYISSRQTNTYRQINAVNRKKYQKTAEGKKAINEASRRAYIKHKHKWLARAKARYAVSKGILIKPKTCEACKEVKPLQGHHEDYYKPLEVIWLCYGCHAAADRKLEKRNLSTNLS